MCYFLKILEYVIFYKQYGKRLTHKKTKEAYGFTDGWVCLSKTKEGRLMMSFHRSAVNGKPPVPVVPI